MEEKSSKFQERLNAIAFWVDTNKYLASIKDAFTLYMPFTIVGSFGSLLNTIICSPTTGLAAVLPAAANLAPAFSAINFCCLSFMALPIIFLTVSGIARRNKQNELASGVVAMAAYISMITTTFTGSVDLVAIADSLPEGVSLAEGLESAVVSVPGLAAIGQNIFGAQGLFVGMITAILITELFNKLCTVEKLQIKMPPAVPGGIVRSFNIMIPIGITLIISAVFGWGFKTLVGMPINDWIYALLQAPMEALFETLPGATIGVLLMQLFWFLGVHGGLIISPVRNALWASSIAANTAAVAAGAAPTQIFTMGFWLTMIVEGGNGICLALLIAVFLFSKREDYRGVAKLSLVPAIMNISEPVIFGLPLVLNPTLAIPFILSSPLSCAIGMFAHNIGFLSANTFDVPFGIPVGINAFLSFGWQGVVVQAICIAACVALYAPFVIAANGQLKAEAEADAE